MPRVKEILDIGTVQQLRDALIQFYPDMTIGDVFIEPIKITHWKDPDVEYLEIS